MYKILSLDGGGLKGLYTIKMLSKIEKEFNILKYIVQKIYMML